MEHVAGEWTITHGLGTIIIEAAKAARLGIISEIDVGASYYTLLQCEANACLIAAAPTLLAALSNLANSLENDHQACLWCEDVGWDSNGHSPECYLGAANVAIAMAS